jgi:hypothetical protein
MQNKQSALGYDRTSFQGQTQVEGVLGAENIWT